MCGAQHTVVVTAAVVAVVVLWNASVNYCRIIYDIVCAVSTNGNTPRHHTLHHQTISCGRIACKITKKNSEKQTTTVNLSTQHTDV